MYHGEVMQFIEYLLFTEFTVFTLFIVWYNLNVGTTAHTVDNPPDLLDIRVYFSISDGFVPTIGPVKSRVLPTVVMLDSV